MFDIKNFLNSAKSPKMWIMRQAGRYLPQYKLIRSTENTFLDLCYNPKKAAEVTLQPVEIFGFDFTILFSDILVVADSMGLNVKFIENVGPQMQIIKNAEDIKNINFKKENYIFDNISSTIKIVKEKILKNPLIGFVGSPWTVAFYVIGTNGKNHENLDICYKDFFEELVNIILNQTLKYIKVQIESGVDIIKIFDSHSGVASDYIYDKFIIKPTKAIVDYIRSNYPQIQIICFPRCSGLRYYRYVEMIQPDVIACDQFVPIDFMKSMQQKFIVQGNLDPMILLCDKKTIETHLNALLDNIWLNSKNNNFIFNLGHGIVQNTPVENVHFLVNILKNSIKN